LRFGKRSVDVNVAYDDDDDALIREAQALSRVPGRYRRDTTRHGDQASAQQRQKHHLQPHQQQQEQHGDNA